jgi:hypothetical protein
LLKADQSPQGPAWTDEQICEAFDVGQLTVGRLRKTFVVEGLCSGRQGHNPAGESPAVSIARCRHVAIPQFLRVTSGSLRGVNVPAALTRTRQR